MNRRISRAILAVALVIAVTLPLSSAPAADRGIHVTTTTGRTLPLYTDYHALVIGVIDYTNGDHQPGSEEAAQCLGALRHARQRVGVGAGLVRGLSIRCCNRSERAGRGSLPGLPGR